MRTTTILMLLIASALPGARAGEMPQVQSYSITVAYDDQRAEIEGDAEIIFVQGSEAVRPLTFYLHGELRVEGVQLDGELVEFDQDLVWYPADYSLVARKVSIDMTGRKLPKRVEVRYSGKLNPSVVRAPSNYMRVDTEGVFLRSFRYSVWFPVFLDADEDTYPVDAEVTVRTPADFMAVVTGDRLSDEVDDGKRVSRWSARSADIFEIQLTVRRFELTRMGGVHLYGLKDEVSRAKAGRILEFTDRVGTFYRQNYSKEAAGGQLHVAQLPKFGDISSGNMVGISERVWREFDPASFSGRTLAHELVHPYVQIPAPRSSELYALLVEGFPSYFHLPAMAEILGEDFYREYLDATEAGYLRQRETGTDRRGRTLPPEKPLLDLTAADIPIYKDRFVLNDRARLFCNWLRSRMGPEQFRAFTLDLFSKGALDYQGFVELIERHIPNSGDDVALWLRTTEFPERFRIDPGS